LETNDETLVPTTVLLQKSLKERAKKVTSKGENFSDLIRTGLELVVTEREQNANFVQTQEPKAS
jgi:Arc/MetJ-type ribon-helix-helix transcriptional regulator